MHETQPRHQDVTAEVMHMSQAGSLQGPSGVMGGHNQLLGVSMGDSRRWDRQRRRGDPSALMFGFRSRRWDRRCRAIRGSGIGGVGRSEGAGSAAPHRGSAGCHLWKPPICLFGASYKALSLREPSVQRPYSSSRRRIYRNSPISVKKLGASWFERASRRPRPARHPGTSMSDLLHAQPRRRRHHGP